MRKSKKGQQIIRYRDLSKFNLDEAVKQITEIEWESAVMMIVD